MLHARALKDAGATTAFNQVKAPAEIRELRMAGGSFHHSVLGQVVDSAAASRISPYIKARGSGRRCFQGNRADQILETSAVENGTHRIPGGHNSANNLGPYNVKLSVCLPTDHASQSAASCSRPTSLPILTIEKPHFVHPLAVKKNSETLINSYAATFQNFDNRIYFGTKCRGGRHRPRLRQIFLDLI